MLYDQYRKLAQTTKHNVLLVPLGDDFRYTDLQEFSLQFDNYQQLFAFMNQKENWNIEVTLEQPLIIKITYYQSMDGFRLVLELFPIIFES